MPAPPVVLHRAAAVRDALGTHAQPGAVAVCDGRILAAGRVDDVARALARQPDCELDHGSVVLMPAFVNAHAHLDLAAIGPRPFDGSFADWAAAVAHDRPPDPDAIAAALAQGLAASQQAGVGWVGDIAGSEHAVRAWLALDPTEVPGGVSWLECFGIGRRQHAAADRAEALLTALRAAAPATSRVRVDLQPHAPFSAGPALYARAMALGAPATHLAETPEEHRFVAHGDGPLADLLRSFGSWDDSIVAQHCSPVRALADQLACGSWVLAHCNYLDDDDLDLLAARPGVSIAYCPVASEYFGHVGHRYSELLARGVNVCLGTDSVLCQPADEPQPHGILAQARRLWRRDRTDPDLLLAMATVRGARALGLPPRTATLTPGAPAVLCTIECAPDAGLDAWTQALDGCAPLLAVADPPASA